MAQLLVLGACLALPVSGAITKFRLIDGEHSACQEGESKVKGDGSGVNGDFNQDAGSIWIWGCITDGSISDNPITDLAVYAADSGQSSCPDSWQMVPHTWDSGDINDHSGGKFVYICEKRESTKAPLTDFKVSDDTCPAGMFRITTLGSSNGDLNQDAGGPFRYGCVQRACVVTSMTGHWEALQVISLQGSVKVTVGTSSTYSETATKEWSESAKMSLEEGLKVEGVGSETTTFSQEVTAAMSDSYSTEFSRTTQVERTYTFAEDDVTKQLWQFVMSPSDSCGHAASTDINEIALTKGRYEPPCCAPGWATDAPTYRTCKTQASMINITGCQVAQVAGFFP
jgi:hypothetical protein